MILGGGFGGLVTALYVAKHSPDSDVVLVDLNPTHVYTPWLYEVATGFLIDAKKSKIAALEKSAGFLFFDLIRWSGAKHLRYRHAAVIGCDLKTKHVLLEGGKTLSYDKLVIALGSETEYYGIAGVKEHGFDIKTLANAVRIRRQLEKLFKGSRAKGERMRTIMIAGAGATGTECAAELANFLKRCERSGICRPGTMRVILLDAGPSILPQFTSLIKKWAHHRLGDLGVEIFIDTVVTRVEQGKVIVEPRQMSEDEICLIECPFQKKTELDVDLLIWAGGIRPNRVLEQFALPKDRRGRIKVTPTMQVEGHPDVFALGDAVSLLNPRTDRLVPPLANATVGEAKVVAQNLIRSFSSRPLTMLTFPKTWPSIIPLGGKFAIVHIGGITFKGRFAIVLRRLVDLRYFMAIMPFSRARQIWRQGTTLFANND